MVKSNPMNPHTRGKTQTQKDVAPPIQKAEVVQSYGHERDGDKKGWHTVRVSVFGEDSSFVAPVLTASFGDVNIPRVGDTVAVLFGEDEKPYVIGYWYATDEKEPSSYIPGDRILGNGSGSFIKLARDGHIEISTKETQRVDIDNQAASVWLSTDQTIAGGATDKIEFNEIEEDLENLYDEQNHQFIPKADGLHRITATAEIQAAGQNNIYTFGLHVNGTQVKRINRQSSVNEPVTLQVATMERLFEGDKVDVRLTNNSGSQRTIAGDKAATGFDIQRTGI